MCTSQGYRGFKSLSLRQRESLLPCMATGFLRAQKRARQKPVRLRQRLFPLRGKNHRNNVTRLRLAAINRCSVAALLLLTNPSLCAKSTPKRGVFSLLRRFYAEFLVFRFPKLCTRMRVNSEGNFYIAVPCEALANIHIYAALRTTCNKISKIFLSMWQMFVRACRAEGVQDNKKDGHSPSFFNSFRCFSNATMRLALRAALR